MPINDLKFKESDFAGQGVSDLPDRPNQAGMSAEQLKARFDNLAKVVVALGRINDLIDALTASTPGESASEYLGAGPISGITGTTVRDQLANLKLQLDNAIIGEISPGGITRDMLASDIVEDLNGIIGVASVSASKTISSADTNTLQLCGHADTQIDITIPLNSVEAISIGSSFAFGRTGVAEVVIVKPEGVTINPGNKLRLKAQGSTAAIIKTGTDEWMIAGSLKE